MFWAATKTGSNGVADGGVSDGDHVYNLPEWDQDAIGPLLLSKEGLRGLAKANKLTPQEVNGLLNSGLPSSQYPYILLEWVGLYAMEGLCEGVLDVGVGVEDQLMKRLTDIPAKLLFNRRLQQINIFELNENEL